MTARHCRSCGSGPLGPAQNGHSGVARAARSARHEGRGLCGRCYWAHHRAGTLDQFPRLFRRRGELASAALRARRYCRTWAEVAQEVKSTPGAIEAAIRRTRDERRR